ncbi:hypothetical protein KV112_11305 [Mycolicibacter sp. MYC123]|uniref:Secreted protein n=1 Tax=[Mycobacterium] zoologicum TaxID=2872311 RepID=A0ABU5YJU4_9MYCO|nr:MULTISPECIES: hypothetical protein [unclassified Mycolicibacter]MEB3050317.1 hypothetical protein [Mycolicibacter sp. MYC123]MEB3062766.1 hypothetical protein [Mycolicibacter sp. MYC101]
MTLGRRRFAAALLAPRPASVPSIASPNTPGGNADDSAGAGVPVPAGAGVTDVSTADQPCGTDNAPTRLARPASAETGRGATVTGPDATTGRADPTMNGPMPWCSSRKALTANAWLVVWIEIPENVELVVDAAAHHRWWPWCMTRTGCHNRAG